MIPTWRELARRAAAVAYVWYRHAARRWWRRHITTNSVRRRLHELACKHAWADQDGSSASRAMRVCGRCRRREYCRPRLDIEICGRLVWSRELLPPKPPRVFASFGPLPDGGYERRDGSPIDVLSRAVIPMWTAMDDGELNGLAQAGIAGSRYAREYMVERHRARLLAELRYQDVDDAMNMITGINPYLLPRPSDETS
jgi:hypothetical protein